MDGELRRLERAWLESHDPADHARYLLARARTGGLSQRALELAAAVGVPGAVLAVPEVARPELFEPTWASLAVWADGLVARVREDAEASWRLLHAEGERVLRLLTDPALERAGSLVVVEGVHAGQRFATAGPVYVGADGGRVAPAEAVFRIEAADEAGAFRLVALQESVTINGEPAGPPHVLQHGDLVGFGAWISIFDASDYLRDGWEEAAPAARLWLDDVAAGIAGAELSVTELPPEIPYGGVLAQWLVKGLPRLRAAVARRAPAPLQGWPLVGPLLGFDEPAWCAAPRACAREALGRWALEGADPIRGGPRGLGRIA